MTRLSRAITALEQAVAARDAHRDRELAAVDRQWAPKMHALRQEYHDAAREAAQFGPEECMGQ